MPSVPPLHEGTLDAGYIMQMQFQMHAAGAEYGVLVSWSIRDISIFRVPYSFDLVRATAHVLRHVIAEYLAPAELPTLPQRFSELPNDVQASVIAVHKELGAVLASCTREPLPGELRSLCNIAA